jgi:ABC-2 type transport system ATP-binding protein
VPGAGPGRRLAIQYIVLYSTAYEDYTAYERHGMTEQLAVEAIGLEKAYGRARALAGLELGVRTGTVLALLGPNGAGKTTAVRVLATLLRPDRGRATVAGYDVVSGAAQVRQRIALTGQTAALDEYLTGRANLVMVGQLCRLSRRRARQRAAELLVRFDLAEAADHGVKTYSGGMRRRLDLAAGLVGRPEVLFLDEPTTGLDPRNRAVMWDVLRALVADGTTVLLTTQYLDEADRLADHIAVVDQGRVIAQGTPAELKAGLGSERVRVTVAYGPDLGVARDVLARHADGEPRVRPGLRTVEAPVAGAARRLPGVIADLTAAGVVLDDLELRRASLDDVFLALTGHASSTAAADQPDKEPAPL